MIAADLLSTTLCPGKQFKIKGTKQTLSQRAGLIRSGTMHHLQIRLQYVQKKYDVNFCRAAIQELAMQSSSSADSACKGPLHLRAVWGKVGSDSRFLKRHLSQTEFRSMRLNTSLSSCVGLLR
jgi:hypothetical protein